MPSPRLVSTLTTGSFSSPSGRFSMLLMVFGQFVDHDMAHTPTEALQCCDVNGNLPFTNPVRNTRCLPIKIPNNDPFFRTKDCMNFVRSDGTPRLDCAPGPVEQVKKEEEGGEKMCTATID